MELRRLFVPFFLFGFLLGLASWGNLFAKQESVCVAQDKQTYAFMHGAKPKMIPSSTDKRWVGIRLWNRFVWSSQAQQVADLIVKISAALSAEVTTEEALTTILNDLVTLDERICRLTHNGAYALAFDHRLALASIYTAFEKVLDKVCPENLLTSWWNCNQVRKKFLNLPLWRRELITTLVNAAKGRACPIDYLMNLLRYVSGLHESSAGVFLERCADTVPASKMAEKYEDSYRVQREKALAKKYGKIPTVALCLSGGGYRAMIAGCGFLSAAQHIGLLDKAMYVSALSGSTWLVGSLLAHNKFSSSAALRGIVECSSSLLPLVNHLKAATQQSLISGYDKDELTAIENVLEQKKQEKQRVQLVDFWGALLAQRLLGTQAMYFSQCMPNAATFPFPIFTATIPYGNGEHEWLAITPSAIDCCSWGVRLPLHACGNLFKSGYQVTSWAEQRLGFYFGVCGSAFAADLKTVLMAMGYRDKTSMLGGLLDTVSPFAALQPNFVYNPDSTEEFLHNRSFKMVDAGIDFNLPMPPLLKRNVDVILVCDASSDAVDADNGYSELRKAARYARVHKLPFPDVACPDRYCEGRALVFRHNADYCLNEKAPVVVYFSNAVELDTFKFQVDNEDFDKVYNGMFSAVCAAEPLINQVVAQATTPIFPK